MIYKRGAACWYRFKWSIKREDGSREYFLIRRSARTRSQRKALEVEEEHRRALRLGQIHPNDQWPPPIPQKCPTLSEFVPRFLKFADSTTKSGTRRFYGISTHRILRYSVLAECRLGDVSGELVSKYVQWWRGQSNASISSVNADLRTLRRIFRIASEWGLVTRTPLIRELPGQKIRERVIGHEEEFRYLNAASATLRDLAMLAVDTGLRPNSELFVLGWGDIHLGGSAEAPQGFLHVREGKTDSAARNIPLTPRTREILLGRRSLSNGSRYVFPGPGNSGHIMTVQHAHERAAKKAGIAPFPFYCWRHTFGTRCAESGMDRFSLARLMGHSSPSVAERYYIHVSDSHVAAEFDRFVAYQAAKQIGSVAVAIEKIQ